MLRIYSLRETIQSLEEAVASRGAKENEIKLYLEMLQCGEKSIANFSIPEIDSENILVRWKKNLPALDESQKIYDLSAVHNLFESLARILLEHVPHYEDEVEKILNEDASYFARSLSSEEDFNSEIVRFLVAHAIHPFQVKTSQAVVEKKLNLEKWIKGICPLCGGAPDMAALDKDVGRRTLLCSQCDCEWSYQRIGCPFCGNQDFNRIYYYTDEKGPYRLYLCEECGQYLKAVDLREVAKPLALTAERYLTQSLDAAAKEARAKKNT